MDAAEVAAFEANPNLEKIIPVRYLDEWRIMLFGQDVFLEYQLPESCDRGEIEKNQQETKRLLAKVRKRQEHAKKNAIVCDEWDLSLPVSCEHSSMSKRQLEIESSAGVKDVIIDPVIDLEIRKKFNIHLG